MDFYIRSQHRDYISNPLQGSEQPSEHPITGSFTCQYELRRYLGRQFVFQMEHAHRRFHLRKMMMNRSERLDGVAWSMVTNMQSLVGWRRIAEKLTEPQKLSVDGVKMWWHGIDRSRNFDQSTSHTPVCFYNMSALGILAPRASKSFFTIRSNKEYKTAFKAKRIKLRAHLFT